LIDASAFSLPKNKEILKPDGYWQKEELKGVKDNQSNVMLLCGDSFELVKQMEDESVNLVLTDIPYNISKANRFTIMGRTGIDFGEWDKGFDVNQLSELQRLVRKGGSFFTFHSHEQVMQIRDALSELVFKDLVIWRKNNPMPRNRDRRYISNIEFASWYVKPGDTWTFNRVHESYDECVMTYPSESGAVFKRYHPCQKNVKLLHELIERHSNIGDVILDPFMGSGSTGVACMEMGRSFIGIEADKGYFEIAEKRIKNAEEQQIQMELL